MEITYKELVSVNKEGEKTTEERVGLDLTDCRYPKAGGTYTELSMEDARKLVKELDAIIASKPY